METSYSRIKKSIFINLIVYVFYLLVWVIFLTCKKTYSKNKLPNDSCVVVFWHSRLAFMSFAYLRYWTCDFNKKRKGKVVISDHRDGEIITRIIKFFGISTIRGSSSKGGAKVLINALKNIKEGVDIIITPDGPRGPRHSIADGAIAIAQKTNRDIYILNYEASSFWELRSWDKMIIPKPFSTINFTLSKPLSFNELDIDAAKEELQTKMWLESEKNPNGKSILEHKEEFVLNLKQWWSKNAKKH
ncbi:lysophospholipid acyltransferase family protein (DUF374 domain) [Campylobacter pinnipediorum subsp. caledonicus]|uniref:Lysophospholipid acyltransferase family protein (DUF374 domain) n=1 Tax=Campylobacter pinnipediorum subsp. caledonicus TaxID=1874362 RepID=A0A1S6U8F5_9BACT|nr:lysophospholipid acyltransferase family protein (DUF374 domain) [Campylobacter pinnipediorum subsp. caledonicus]AQW88026.1 lysophospholipid acyltransferase family protein (DUF374 domain) [Campylobacter pinnipediorum subsp. caledonicus]OPA71473.1 hypothetical protein BB381_02965 [Campylobacter pinnipediorum subsp. caledonicus]